MAKDKDPGDVALDESTTKRRRGRQPAPIDPETGERVKLVKHPVPDGFDIPADFFIYVSYNEITNAGNATVYSWIRGATPQPITDEEGNQVVDENGNPKFTEPNGFPAYTHTDGRTIVDRAAGVEWIKQHESAKAQRQAQQAERALQTSVRLRNNAVRLCGIMAKGAVLARSSSGE